MGVNRLRQRAFLMFLSLHSQLQASCSEGGNFGQLRRVAFHSLEVKGVDAAAIVSDRAREESDSQMYTQRAIQDGMSGRLISIEPPDSRKSAAVAASQAGKKESEARMNDAERPCVQSFSTGVT